MEVFMPMNMRAQVRALNELKGQRIDDLYIEHQSNGASPMLVIRAGGLDPVTITLVRRPPGDSIGMMVEVGSSKQLV